MCKKMNVCYKVKLLINYGEVSESQVVYNIKTMCRECSEKDIDENI
jgi:hypothetical protein